MIARLLPAVLLLCATQAHAQQQDEQLWLQVNTNVPVTDGVRVTLEQIGRWGDRADGLYQTEFGALLGYRVATGVELGFGYRKVGLHGDTDAGDVTSSAARNPTVTLTLAVAFEYVLPFASV